MAHESMSVRMPKECREYLEEIVKRGDAKNPSNALIMIVIERMEKEAKTGPRPFKTQAPRDPRKPRSSSKKIEERPKRKEPEKRTEEAPRRERSTENKGGWTSMQTPDLSGWTEEQKRVFYQAHPELQGKE